MQGGTLRHHITFQSPIDTADSFGGVTRSWEDEFNAWAEIDPPKGREYFAAGQTQSEVTTRIRIRYRPSVVTKWRVKYGTRYFNINSIIDPDERHIEQIMMCTEQ